MDEETLHGALNRLRIEHIKIIYWLSKNQNNGTIAQKLNTNATDIHFKRKFIEETLEIAGIKGIKDSARIYPLEIIDLINKTVGSPPDWSKWPPPLPRKAGDETVNRLEAETKLEEGSGSRDEETTSEEWAGGAAEDTGEARNESGEILEGERQFGIEEDPPLESERVQEISEVPPSPQSESDESRLPFDQQRQVRMQNIFSWRNLLWGILVVAILFGFWRLILTLTDRINPITGETLQQTPSSETAFDATQQPTADSQAAIAQTLTARAPTPNVVQTQTAFDAQVAQNVAATETALVADTPSPTPTETFTPTPSWTPSPTLTPSPVPPPPSDNLVLHLPLDGNAVDASGNGLNAQSISALPTEGRYGEPGTAYFFNGESAIVIPDALELRGNTYPLTVAAWINPVRTNGVNPVIVKYLNASRKDWGLRIDDDLLTFTSEDGTSSNNRADYVCRQNSGTVIRDTWQMVAFVADEPNLYLYLNGELVASCSEFVGRWTDTEQPVELGMIGYQGIGYVGTIDDVQIWNRALSPEEMLNLYLFTK